MRLCISIASILFVTIPAVAATVTVRPETPDRPIVVVVEGALAAFDEDQFAANDPPPLKWSDLRYVFDIQEDCNGKEAIQA